MISVIITSSAISVITVVITNTLFQQWNVYQTRISEQRQIQQLRNQQLDILLARNIQQPVVPVIPQP